MRPIKHLLASVSILIPLIGCGESPRSRPSSGRLADPDRTPLDSPAAAPPFAPCDSLLPIQVFMRGHVDREIRLGPPGYGETPTRDLRDTILVLRLPRPVSVCLGAISAIQGARRVEVDAIQLTGRVDGLRDAISREVGVFGLLFQAELGGHYTDVLIRVDSIISATVRRGPVT